MLAWYFFKKKKKKRKYIWIKIELIHFARGKYFIWRLLLRKPIIEKLNFKIMSKDSDGSRI